MIYIIIIMILTPFKFNIENIYTQFKPPEFNSNGYIGWSMKIQSNELSTRKINKKSIVYTWQWKRTKKTRESTDVCLGER